MSFVDYLSEKNKKVNTKVNNEVISEENDMIEDKLDILIKEIRGLRNDLMKKLNLKTESVETVEQPYEESVEAPQAIYDSPGGVLKSTVSNEDLSRISSL